MTTSTYTIESRKITGKSLGRLCERLDMYGMHLDGTPAEVYDYDTMRCITKVRKTEGRWEFWNSDGGYCRCHVMDQWYPVVMPKHNPRTRGYVL